VQPSTSHPLGIPHVIQGGMGMGVSGNRLARTVAMCGGLGVVSGVATDTLLARRLQDGDPTGDLRRALAAHPDQELVAATITKFFRPEGRCGAPYRPMLRLDVGQRRAAVQLVALGAFVEVWLAKEGHSGPIGINLLEKIQTHLPATLAGAMLAGVDVVLVGAGIPANLPRLINGLAKWEPVSYPIDVAEAPEGAEFFVNLDPAEVLGRPTPQLHRPAFLAIVASHVLAQYLARDPLTRPDGFVVEGPVAGGHNAPPRGKLTLDDDGDPIYGAADDANIDRLLALNLPFWLAGGYGTPARVDEALELGAAGVQVGTVFALSHESGFRGDVRLALRGRLADGVLRVRTDPAASPTGFPFKVAQLPGTIGETETYNKRVRECDMGYLREAYVRENGNLSYRCPAEPVDAYLRKGGKEADTVGSKCLCNGLAADIGLAQVQGEGMLEAPLVTLGADLQGASLLLAEHPEGWSAVDVVNWLDPAAVAPQSTAITELLTPVAVV
jgi:NAD(P)H-dependent flavin oxidoreductase YrpB (nitropropane dioxygenase family)